MATDCGVYRPSIIGGSKIRFIDQPTGSSLLLWRTLDLAWVRVRRNRARTLRQRARQGPPPMRDGTPSGVRPPLPHRHRWPGPVDCGHPHTAARHEQVPYAPAKLTTDVRHRCEHPRQPHEHSLFPAVHAPKQRLDSGGKSGTGARASPCIAKHPALDFLVV